MEPKPSEKAKLLFKLSLCRTPLSHPTLGLVSRGRYGERLLVASNAAAAAAAVAAAVASFSTSMPTPVATFA